MTKISDMGETHPDGKDSITVKIRKTLPAKRWKVLRLITRLKEFPKNMPNVKECTVLERDGEGAVTCWSVEVDKIPFSWKQRDTFDFKNFAVRFRSVEGDLEHFEGSWTLREHPEGGTDVEVEASVRIGIPLIEQVIGRMVADKLKKNFELMLFAIEEMLTTQRYKNIRDRRCSDLKGFAVIGHPYNFQHLIRYLKHFKPDLKLPRQEFLSKIFEMTPAYRSYDIRGFRSKTGQEVNGYFIMCPIIPDMLQYSMEKVVEKVVEACKVAEKLGVGIVTLGGFTSIAGEKFGKSLTHYVNVPVTTGNVFTVALTIQGICKASLMMGIDLDKANVTVIGGTGDIGGSCAQLLADRVRQVTITGRSEKNLMEAERVLSYRGKAVIKTSRDNNTAIRDADIVLAAASVSASMIDFSCFKPGSIICDVGYPKNISYTECKRNDILIFSGGIASLPGDFDLGFDIGMPSPRTLYGCFSEAILLDLEERYENFSWGRGTTTREKVEYIQKIGEKHGFGLAPFFWGNNLLEEEDLARIRELRRSAVMKHGT